MKKILFVLIALALVTACTSSQATPSIEVPTEPATAIPTTPPTEPPTLSPLPTTDVKATLMATDPSLVLTFDGNECVVEGPEQLTIGEHVFVFHNLSEHTSYFTSTRHYPGNSWEDALAFIEENCGPPGTYCMTYAAWMAPFTHEQAAYDGLNTHYKLYDLKIEGNYGLWTENSSRLLWPCGPFSVVAGP